MIRPEIFIVEDSSFVSLDIKKKLTKVGYKVSGIAMSGEVALKKIQENPPDMVIMDIILLGEKDGIETANEIKERFKIPIIYLTSHTDEKTVKRASKTDPIGYLVKPVRAIQMKITVDMAFDRVQAEKQVKKVKNRLQKKNQEFDDLQKKYSLISNELKNNIELNLVGESKAIKKILHRAMKAAENSVSNVLITGESGTGKEIIARIIHYASSRKKNYFCAINSSAIPETLLESEFFGHEKGSFTGAVDDNIGFFEMADKGSVFLDEIGDMPFHLQAKILRVIESKIVKRIGSQKEKKLDFRVISSTNKNPQKLVKKNKFRLDLLHRLNTIHIHIPPLRERKKDIKPLLEYFVNTFSVELKRKVPEISPDISSYLENYDFPGNVRELKNLVESALIHDPTDKLSIKDFSIYPIDKRNEVRSTELADTGNLNIKDHEKMLIKKALKVTQGNKTKAAKKLGFSRDTLRRKIKSYQITQ